MSSLNKIAICLLFLCAGVNYAFSDIPEQINFSYISINEGLSQSTVFSIDQDQRGNMWFATYDGVNKYDGYSFTVYQHNEDDPNSIANDISRIVKTDSQGRVWIARGMVCHIMTKKKTNSEISSTRKRQTATNQWYCRNLTGTVAYKHTRRSDYVRY